MVRIFSLLIVFFWISYCSAQFDYRYDKDLLSKEFHKERREALRKLMPDSSVAVFFANPIKTKSNDVEYQFSQDPNFYYLSGLNETDAVLLIFKENQKLDTLITNEIIFVQKKDPLKEVWTGRRLGSEGVKKTLGFKYVFGNTDFADFKINFDRFYKVYQPKFYDDVRDDPEDNGDSYSLISQFKSKTSKRKTDIYSLISMMGKLREIKQPEEISLLKKAIDISVLAHAELMKALSPDMTEYQAQAIIEYFFKKEGSEYPGYPSIAGGGENSCILHYSSNRKPLEKNELLLIDAGAEYHGYSADVTRTLPANGKYSPEQKIIYNIVLEAQEAGIKECHKGNSFRAPNNAATEVIKKRLLEQGIIKSGSDYRKYFFHGTSHYIGLDVHDAGTYGKLQPNSVITVEPGIYIPEGSDCDKKWWNIGVRIEDDILITESDPENLSEKLPRKVEDIESLMKEPSIFDKKGKD